MKPDSGKLKREIEAAIYCTCFKCKPKVVKRLLMIVNRTIAASEAKIRQLNDSLIRMNADCEKMLAEKDKRIKELEP
jgi:hypothetical protein